MSQRTSTSRVEGVITTQSSIKLQPCIDAAVALTDYLASKDSDGLLTTDLLLQIETYLAAHFYALRDPQAQEEKTLDASAKWQGETGKGLESTWWGQQTLALDVTGVLARKRAGAEWLGLAPTDQTDYVKRD